MRWTWCCDCAVDASCIIVLGSMRGSCAWIIICDSRWPPNIERWCVVTWCLWLREARKQSVIVVCNAESWWWWRSDAVWERNIFKQEGKYNKESNSFDITWPAILVDHAYTHNLPTHFSRHMPKMSTYTFWYRFWTRPSSAKRYSNANAPCQSILQSPFP